jgi:hypothetical protein
VIQLQQPVLVLPRLTLLALQVRLQAQTLQVAVTAQKVH